MACPSVGLRTAKSTRGLLEVRVSNLAREGRHIAVAQWQTEQVIAYCTLSMAG